MNDLFIARSSLEVSGIQLHFLVELQVLLPVRRRVDTSCWVDLRGSQHVALQIASTIDSKYATPLERGVIDLGLCSKKCLRESQLESRSSNLAGFPTELSFPRRFP